MIKLAGIQPPTDTTPVAALEFAQREKLQGPVFNDYDFGGFLIHAGVPTFIDGRGELFGGDFIKRYADAIKLRGDDPLGLMLDRHCIEWTLLHNDQPANKLLELLPGLGIAPTATRRQPSSYGQLQIKSPGASAPGRPSSHWRAFAVSLKIASGRPASTLPNTSAISCSELGSDDDGDRPDLGPALASSRTFF